MEVFARPHQRLEQILVASHLRRTSHRRTRVLAALSAAMAGQFLAAVRVLRWQVRSLSLSTDRHACRDDRGCGTMPRMAIDSGG
ncbi:hypothetical protein NDU88_005387 [Pleurodeles waltl]|uniref:Uncharacterized protein n=1 Tax=Pleurodeles waltl TaxID=8319 RepID=A0AAV7TUL7_PLEWA|nr:hypothetical protein NDU88_005387 [Pleurodeles waltl]